MAVSLKDRLKNILVAKQVITEENLAHLVQKNPKIPLAQVLIKEDIISEKMLQSILSAHTGFPPLDIKKIKLDESIVSLIPPKIAQFYKCLPIAKFRNILSLAMSDPLNVFAIDDIKLMTGLTVRPVICSEKDLLDTLSKSSMQQNTEKLEDVLKDMQVPDLELKRDEEADELDLDKIIEQTGEAPVIKIVNVILFQALRQRASDIHLEPFEKKIRLRYRIDGILYEDTPPPKHLYAALISRIKIMSNLNIAERRVPQDGRFKIRMQGKEVDFRVSILPTAHGEKVVLRVLDKGSVSLNLSNLGFSKNALDLFKESIARPHGMVLVTGPTGSGKTTTLYSALQVLNKTQVNIITVEDPIEYQFHGINQVQAKAGVGLTFAEGLRSILRQDPDIVMVGEIRDFETADISIKAALTGHLVLSTLHTNDAAGAVTRLIDMGVEPFLVSSSLVSVVAQRLLRKICKNCKEQILVPTSVIERLKVDSAGDYTFYEGRGCDLCKNSGYSGRFSIVEILMVDEEIKHLINQEADAFSIKQAALKNGMTTLRLAGLEKAMAGITTLEEVLRVTAGD